jgi:inorganic pyrophosphatase
MIEIHRRFTPALALAAIVMSLAPAAVTAGEREAARHHGQPLPLLTAPMYRLVPGDYAAGVPDSLVFLPDRDLNLYRDLGTLNADGTANAVIEIPQGTTDKWETDVDSGRLIWELKNGAPRVVKYLGYPANYGMSPRTLGGDGDPLDVLVLGKIELRGTIAKARIVGVMRMIDGGDLDDKLIAVVDDGVFAGKTLADLEAMGVTAILKTWFESYKGPGEIQVPAFDGAEAAMATLQEAMANYAAANP